MSRLIPHFVIAIVLHFACASFAFANQVKEDSLAEKVENSDLVIIARVVATTPGICASQSRCATLDVLTVLKGEYASKPIVLFDGPIAEFNSRCCELGSTYLFLIARNDEGFYHSVNGPFGIYPVDASTGETN